MKRILASVLALAMILVVMLLAGCGNSEVDTTTPGSSTLGTTAGNTTSGSSGGETTSSSGGDSETTASTPDETTTLGPNDGSKEPLRGYEDVTFNGRKFVIAARTDTGDGYDSVREVYADTEMTDAISVAVRERNKLVENFYNCTIEMMAVENPGQIASDDVNGNQHTIDLYTTMYGDLSKATNGNNYNFYNYGLTFENDWWDQNWVNSYTIKNDSGNDTLYSVIGDFAITSFSCTYTLFYNKTVMENSGITDDIYELVRNKEWTMDKFIEMAKTAAKDQNNNGTFSVDEGDIIGWGRTGHATHALHVASDMSIIANNDGVLSFNVTNNADRWVDVITKAGEVWAIPEAQTIGYTTLQPAVESGNVLFCSEIMQVLERMKDSDATIGLVPYPLYDTAQENYAHYVDNHVFTYSMPVSVTDPETVATFFELYAFHSKDTVRRAYIETYSYVYCGDADSAEMLEIILNSRTYDPAYHYWISYEGGIGMMISNNKNQIAAWSNRNANLVAESISAYIVGISDNDD